MASDMMEKTTGQEFPCGLMQCTCEKFPRVTKVNDYMLTLLGVREDDPDWRDFLSENIFLLIPPEDRDAFRSATEAAKTSDTAVALAHRIWKPSGETVSLSGWARVVHDKSGQPFLDLMYVESAPHNMPSQVIEDNSYFNALRSAYGVIFEVNLPMGTVECIHGRETSDIGSLSQVRMTIDSAKSFWLDNYIVERDREMMSEYFDLITRPGAIDEANRPLQVVFEMLWTDGVVYRFIGVAVQLGAGSILFCCRDITEARYDSSSYLSSAGIPSDGVFIRTFGHFDVFVNGVPVIFSSPKEKELMALLVDRNGGTLTCAEAIGILWENEPVTDRLKARCRKLMFTLKGTLARYGVDDILVQVRGARSVNTAAVLCDYYEYLAGNETYVKAFRNAYLTGYSWAEQTLGSLWN